MNDQLIEIILGVTTAISLGFALYMYYTSQSTTNPTAQDMIADGDFDDYAYLIRKVTPASKGDTTQYILRKICIADLNPANGVTSCGVTDYPIGADSSVYITVSDDTSGVCVFSDMSSTTGTATFSALDLSQQPSILTSDGLVNCNNPAAPLKFPANTIGWVSSGGSKGGPGIIGHLSQEVLDTSGRAVVNQQG
jgi:hypothetical protein